MSAGVLNGIIFKSVLIVLPMIIGPINIMNEEKKNIEHIKVIIPQACT